MPRKSLLPLLLAVAGLLAVLPSPAQAKTNQSMTFEAPRELVYEPELRQEAFTTLESLGVRSLRIVLYWKTVAPDSDSRVKPGVDLSDPGSYNWTGYDEAIQGAVDHGWDVLLTVSGPVPRWATNGARDTVTRPSPREFQRFVSAVATHYRGKVRTYSVWNEPNQPQFLGPQFDARRRPASPRIYRGLLFAALRGLEDAGQRDGVRVLMGETSPQGTGRVVAPLTFLRGALCLSSSYKRDRKCDKVPVDGYAHHAYTTKAGPLYRPPSPNSVTIGVLPRLTRALDRAGTAGALPKRLPVWLTEFGIQSVPDPTYGVSQATQNEYRALAERMAWGNSRVVSFSQYLLRDDRPLAGETSSGRYAGFESGLRTAGGKDKLALDGFRLALSARRSGSGVSLWGIVRPARSRQKAVIEYTSDGRRFKKLATVTTSTRGAFSKRTSSVRGRRYRVVWTAPGGERHTGPPVRVR